MSPPSENNSDIEYAASGILETLERLETEPLPQKGRASAHGSIARKACDIGLYRLLDDDAGAAVPWFDHASSRFLRRHETYKEYVESLDQSKWEGEPISLRHALHTAFLSGSSERRRDAANAVRGVDRSYPEAYPESRSRYDYVRALAAVIEDDPGCEAFVTRLATNLDGTPDGAREKYAAYATVLQGVNEHDVATVRGGLQAIVEDHVAALADDPSRIDESVSVEAAALAVLARVKGLDVVLENEFVPSATYELAELETATSSTSIRALVDEQVPDASASRDYGSYIH